MRLIDADALIRGVSVKFYTTPYFKHILDLIDNAPTVEQPKGKWIMNKTSQRGRNYTCTNCEKISRNKFTYCPNCGAEMEAEIKATKRPQGKWIFNKYNVWECSCCGGNPHSGTGYVPSIPMMKKQWKFCNLCGAQMGVDDNETDN